MLGMGVTICVLGLLYRNAIIRYRRARASNGQDGIWKWALTFFALFGFGISLLSLFRLVKNGDEIAGFLAFLAKELRLRGLRPNELENSPLNSSLILLLFGNLVIFILLGELAVLAGLAWMATLLGNRGSDREPTRIRSAATAAFATARIGIHRFMIAAIST
jgi:hypothetical protein